MDGDGLDNAQELAMGSDPTRADSDGDGLSDGAEKTLGSNALVADTDGDGLLDGAEVDVYSTNPLAGDSDGDGVPDGAEVGDGTDPNDKDSFTPITMQTEMVGARMSWTAESYMEGCTVIDTYTEPDGTTLVTCTCDSQPHSESDHPHDSAGYELPAEGSVSALDGNNPQSDFTEAAAVKSAYQGRISRFSGLREVGIGRYTPLPQDLGTAWAGHVLVMEAEQVAAGDGSVSTLHAEMGIVRLKTNRAPKQGMSRTYLLVEEKHAAGGTEWEVVSAKTVTLRVPANKDVSENAAVLNPKVEDGYRYRVSLLPVEFRDVSNDQIITDKAWIKGNVTWLSGFINDDTGIFPIIHGLEAHATSANQVPFGLKAILRLPMSSRKCLK